MDRHDILGRGWEFHRQVGGGDGRS